MAAIRRQVVGPNSSDSHDSSGVWRSSLAPSRTDAEPGAPSTGAGTDGSRVNGISRAVAEAVARGPASADVVGPDDQVEPRSGAHWTSAASAALSAASWAAWLRMRLGVADLAGEDDHDPDRRRDRRRPSPTRRRVMPAIESPVRSTRSARPAAPGVGRHPAGRVGVRRRRRASGHRGDGDRRPERGGGSSRSDEGSCRPTDMSTRAVVTANLSRACAEPAARLPLFRTAVRFRGDSCGPMPRPRPRPSCERSSRTSRRWPAA